MRDSIVNFVFRFGLVLLATLMITIPIDFYRQGRDGLLLRSIPVITPFALFVSLEPLRRTGRCKKVFEGKTANGMLFRAFILALPITVGNIINAIWPTFYSGGLQFGLLVGLLTPVPYATLDRPQSSNKKYWIIHGLIIGFMLGVVIFFLAGRSRGAATNALVTALFYAVGLWLGLVLGNHINIWINALRPAFKLLAKLGKGLTAFAVGYLTIVLIFSTFFAAIWRLQGSGSFTGLPENPRLSVFVYFSLVTATTVGYGDIVAKSSLARLLTGIELVTALGWTVVVFAALAAQFATGASQPKAP